MEDILLGPLLKLRNNPPDLSALEDRLLSNPLRCLKVMRGSTSGEVLEVRG